MATSRQPTRAKITDRGRAPAAKLAPTMIEKATAAAGAMWVIDWNRTSRRPMASRARPGDGSFRAMSRLLRRLPPAGQARRTVNRGQRACKWLDHTEPADRAPATSRRGGDRDILSRLSPGWGGGRSASVG